MLIAHDNKKADMLEWARFNRETLARHDLLGTGTTGSMVANELGLPVHRFLTGPLGGDQQVGAAIAEGRIAAVVDGALATKETLTELCYEIGQQSHD